VMKNLLAILFLFLFTHNIVGYETTGKLSFEKGKLSLIEGDFVSAQLLLNPYETKDLSSLKELEGKNFIDFFFVNKVKSVKRSENNFDVVLIELDLILIKAFKQREFYIWVHRDLNIPVEFKKIDVKKNDKTDKKFFIWEERISNFNGKKVILYWVLIASLLFLTIYFFKRKNKAGKKIDRDLNALKAFFDENDYWNIYSNKSLLTRYVSNEKANELRKMMEEDLFSKKGDIPLEEKSEQIHKKMKEIKNELDGVC
jgi:hypothetical protein